jgi:hypothetical protein
VAHEGGGETNSGGGGGRREKVVIIPPLHGDFSLNAANSITAATLLQAGGLSRLAPTHDLDAMQICELAQALAVGGGNGAACEGGDAGGGGATSPIEAVCHQHMPIFHTEHCVFARFLSDGDSYKDCGQPCEQTRVVSGMRLAWASASFLSCTEKPKASTEIRYCRNESEILQK